MCLRAHMGGLIVSHRSGERLRTEFLGTEASDESVVPAFNEE
jgi:hypothetical protein